MAIERNLILSTGHIPKEDGDHLLHYPDVTNGSTLVVEAIGQSPDIYGHHILVPDDLFIEGVMEELAEEGWSPYFRLLLHLARIGEFKWLILDRDQPLERDLYPVFEW